MNFSLTEEQQLLADSLARFLEREYSFEQRRANQRSAAGYGRAAWLQLAEMGVLALPLPAEHGGFGGGAGDVMTVMTALGHGLVVEPYLASVVLGAGLVALAGNEAQQAAILPAVAAGKKLLALAYDDAPRGGVKLRDGTLSGTKRVVLHGGQADTLIVSVHAKAGTSLCLVDRNAAGVKVRDYRTIDGLRAADIAFRGVSVGSDALLGAENSAGSALETVLDRGAAALCAEAVGAMERLNAQTLEYIKARQQFGQPIGRFQVLQHRAVDMFIAAEQSKSMAFLAALKADDPDAAERRRSVAAAKAYIGRAGRKVAQEAIQLHGGMGVTDELPASHYAKRLTMIDFWLNPSGA